MADYSFNPQFANLSGLQPLPAIDVTRGANLQFRPLDKIEIQSSRPELVAEGIAGAISNIAKGALGGITARYEKKEERDKETRKFAQELLLEEAKQNTKNKQFLDELKLKIASEHGLEADVDERMAAVDEAAKRLNMANPSGNTPVVKPSPRKTNIDSDQVYPTPVYQAAETELPTATPVGGWEPSKEVNLAEPLPEAEPIQQPPPSEAKTIQQPPPSVVTVPAGAIKIPDANIQRVSTQGTALAGVQPQPEAAPAPTPPLAEFQAIGKLPEQPTDIKAPRNVAGIGFGPSDSGLAFDTAAKLSTPYWTVTAVENPRTKKWYLQPIDNSKQVADLKNQADAMGISVERLALDKQKEAREAQKAEFERIKEERENLRTDKTYRKKIKNNITEQSKNIELIDNAINKIQDNPELVGVISKYYGDEKKIPLTPVTYEEAAVIAKNFFGVDKYLDKVQKVQDLVLSLNSVAKNVGWNKFAEMKELSQTGSAGVGALSNDERQSLEQTQGALDKNASPDLNLDTLYRLKNGAVKILLNAYSEVKQFEPIENPISTDIYNSYTEKINTINSALQKATPKQKESRNYQNAVKRLESLVRTREAINLFSKPLDQE
jgi:hypothetical protein